MAEHTIDPGGKVQPTGNLATSRYRPNRVVMGTSAVWIGILVADLTFGLLWGASSVYLGQGSLDGIFLTVIALVVGLAPAAFFGWGLGMPLGLLLRPVRNQWLHVAAFGALGALMGLPFGGFGDPPSLMAAAGLAASAALGRLSVWTFVVVHDDVDSSRSHDDGGPPAPGTYVP